MEHEQTTRIPVAPDRLYRTIADIGNLTRFIPPLRSVRRTDAEHVEVDAQYEGHEQRGQAWFRTDDASKRVEWGSEGQPYRGWMHVEDDGDGSRLTLHVTTERLGSEHLGEVKAYVASTIESLRKLF
jgi:ribosome-associated toxin RatA of RatAB toxin-antitoxin module